MGLPASGGKHALAAELAVAVGKIGSPAKGGGRLPADLPGDSIHGGGQGGAGVA